MNPPGAIAYLDEWFVAFVDVGCNLWWHRLTRKGFRHCFAFGWDPLTEVWIVFDPTLETFVLRAVPGRVIDNLVAHAALANGTILRCKTQGKGPRRPRLFATCVTVVGHLLGLKRCAVLPSGLYRKLVRLGAVPAFQEALAFQKDADEEPVRITPEAGSQRGDTAC